MIDFIQGKLDKLTPSYAIIETNGIGYKIFISTRDYGPLSVSSENTRLSCAFIIRENLQSLYGFLKSSDRNLFETLINISGVGPKTALALISTLTPEIFKNAVQNGDITIISKVPGLGKKTAERLIIEMRDKCKTSLDDIDYEDESLTETPANTILDDTINALTNLGYNKKIAEKATKKIISKKSQESYTLASIITETLRSL